MFLNSVRIVCVSLSSFLCVAAFSGCSSTPAPRESADYARSLNRYFQGRPMCLWSDQVSFPAENPTTDQAKARGYDALVSAGLLTRKRTKNSEAVYDLTAAGRAAFDHDVLD